MLLESACLLVINSSNFKVHFAEMTLLSVRSCQPQSPGDMSRGSSVEEKITSSAPELGQAPGTQIAHTSGQCSRETAVPRSSSSAQHSRAGGMFCRWHEDRRERTERLQDVWGVNSL